MNWVPTIDLGSAGVHEAIDDACRRFGFLSIVGHGVDQEVLDTMWATSRSFFDLTFKQRMSVAMPYVGYPYGYSPLAAERLAASVLENGSVGYGTADAKESFSIGPVDPPLHALEPSESFAWSPNLWPVDVPDMRVTWERYYRAMSDLAARLLGSMAEALRLPGDYFAPLIDRHTSALRALNYPALPDASGADARIGAGAHTDYGTITILLADPHVGGLEVVDEAGVWHAVDPVAGALIVNLGDAMERWTNDRWRSTLHRVRAPRERRQSIAFFHNANWDAMIECLPTCLAPGETPKHLPMAAGPHLMAKFTAAAQQ